MTQQINLYQKDLLTKNLPLSGRHILFAVAAAVVVMVLVYGHAQWRTGQMSNRFGALEARRGVVERELETLGKDAGRQKSPLLEQEIQKLLRQSEAKKLVFERFAAIGSEFSGGFSPYVEGLARQNIAGVWLRGIVIGAEGRKIILEGSALRPEQIPGFLQSLSGEDAFRGREFRSLLLDRPDNEPDRIDFILQTHLVEKR